MGNSFERHAAVLCQRFRCRVFIQRRLIEESGGSEYRSGGRDKLELAGRKKCGGDEVQSGSLNVSCRT